MQRRLVVALDYGTSNSGAGYAIVRKDQQTHGKVDPEIIKDWPRASASPDASEKVPSLIAYDAEGKAVGHGFQASRHAEPLHWVKLLLEPESVKEQSDRTSRLWKSYFALDAHVKRPVDVVADYLRWLWRWVKAAIIEREAEDEDSDLFDTATMTVVLTVPAGWSAPAKERIALAAVIAGIPEQCIKTLAEPEAAAVYGLQRIAAKGHVKDGDVVLILDAGGGTVDAVAYQIRASEPLSLDQVTVSKGDFCGSSFVNKEFKSQLRAVLGEKYDQLSERTKTRIDSDFEYEIKRTFNPFDEYSDKLFHVGVDDLEDDSSLGIHQGRMEIDEAILSTAFESVMTQIGTLLDHQIAEIRRVGLYDNFKGLMLVGGFGKSGFLRNRIKQEFPGRHDPKVWAADDSWTAVVRGAVICEASSSNNGPQQSLIHSRLSGYNYGIPFVEDGARKVHWLVRKGQAVEDNSTTAPYGLRIDDEPWLEHDETCLVYVPIVTSGDDCAGDALTASVTSHAEIKCRVATSLRHRPEAQLVQLVPKRAWHIPATLALHFDGALIAFRCCVAGREVGVAEVRYFRDDYGAGCTTAEDAASSAASELSLESGARHERVDSKVSFSEASGGMAPEAKRRQSSSAATTYSRSSSSTGGDGREKGKKKGLFGLVTKRDVPKGERRESRAIVGHNPIMDLPLEERLRVMYQKGWDTRRTSKAGAPPPQQE